MFDQEIFTRFVQEYVITYLTIRHLSQFVSACLCANWFLFPRFNEYTPHVSILSEHLNSLVT